MLNIATKSDYGLILMLELAKNYNSGYLSLTQIAKTKNLSANYLAQLSIPLKQAGLVDSKEGKGGGYKLSKSPDQITVLEIVEAIEGPVNLVKCHKTENHDCQSFLACEAKMIWPAIFNEIKFVLRKKSLASLLATINH
ncbi:MAG TPA: Rrf2 family transcriptional regulator [Patescibacteria group bacterium]